MKKFSSKKKANYHQRLKYKKSVALVGGIILLGLLLPSVIHLAGSVLLYPLHISRVYLSNSDMFIPNMFRERSELNDRIEELTKEISSRSGSEAYIKRLEADNKQLHKLLHDEEPERIAARVTARPPYVPYDIVQVDKGFIDGVKVNTPVFVGRNIVIGFVSHVASDYSHVTLLTTPGQTATAYVVESGIYTTAEGVGDGLLRVRIPQGIDTKIGDTIILPAVFNGVFGTIEHIETTPTQPEQYGYVSLQESLQSLRYVAIGERQMTPKSYSAIESDIEKLRQSLFMIDVPDSEANSSDLEATTTEADSI